jgi:flagellar biosynthesis/type III secretory pathway protein FliH
VAKRKVTARRQQYEAAFPTVTARIPAEVRQRLLAALKAEGLHFSEWVQARVAGSAPQLAAAHERGRALGRKEGEAAGSERGVQVAGLAGFRAGLLASAFAAEHGRSYHALTVARRLLEHPDGRAIAEALIPTDYRKDWARPIRAAERAQAPVTMH